MKKSIVSKYFALCSALILANAIIIGSVLLLVSSQYYKTEKKEALLASANNVIAATRLCFAENVPNTVQLNKIYNNYLYYSQKENTLFDENGHVIVTSRKYNKNLDKSLLKMDIDEVSFSIGTFNDYFDESIFSTFYCFDIYGKKYYLLSNTTCDKSHSEFILKLLNTFIMSTIIASAISFISIHFFNKQLMIPINNMTLAAKRYGRGDFSKKIEITDDDELGILAESLNQMAYDLSVTENSRKSFIANISHELKTPMTTIGGFIDGILDGTIPTEKHRYYLKIVSNEVDRLSRLVRSMLNIAKYESGEIEMNKIDFNIVELTIKTVLLFENKINEKGLEINGLDNDSVLVNADIDLIQQILYNLVENAVKFVNPKGYISFSFTKDQNNISVSIRNSGEGLTEDELPKVFDRFYKTDESHGKDTTGVGLGLAIVRSIINLHGGTILVKSKHLQYTEFTFTLPV